ncbi:hypothetical protein AYI70_g9479, partial [Smittium culicis]
MTDFSLTMKL